MKFSKSRTINKIQVPIVRICNKQCQHCCAREQLTWYNKSITENEISLDEIKSFGDKLGKIDEIEITGGEPTLHSKFEELATNLGYYFKCDDVMLVTNGWLFRRDPSKVRLLLNFQRVYATHYTDAFARRHGGTTNTKEFGIISEFLKNHPRIDFIPSVMDSHIEYKPPFKGRPCRNFRGNMIAYYEGQLYGCCVAWSQPNRGSGIPVTSDFRNHLEEIDIPCENCFMSISVASDRVHKIFSWLACWVVAPRARKR